MKRNSNRPPALDIEPGLLTHVRACIEDIRQGKMVVLVDDEDRENEGDLVFAAEKVSAEMVNFMAKFGRGLICLTLTEAQVERLELPMMTLPPGRGAPPLGTAFTMSIEARDGVTTGISAADRAQTIAVAINSAAKREEIVSPGHVFPLRARQGGVLVRTGQTEGSVDLARLAGLNPSGVICEIMNDDGTMARMPDLEKFSAEHDLRILTIADLIKYRLQTERLVRCVQEREVQLDQSGKPWRAMVYRIGNEDTEFLALVHGTPKADGALCRMHRGSSFHDLFSSDPGSGGNSLREAITRIEAEEGGVIVYIPDQSSLERQLDRIPQQDSSGETPPPASQLAGNLREFGLGAQVLRELKLKRIRLLTNHPRKLVGISGYGLEVLDTLPLGS